MNGVVGLSLLEAEIEIQWQLDNVEFQPWVPKEPEVVQEQAAIQAVLRRRAGATSFGRGCYIARGARILTNRFSLGAASWIAAGVIIRGYVTIGDRSSINPYAHIAGQVKIGNDVRIAGMSAIYGFNHGFDRTDIPIHAQRQTANGITIGDGCWIGTNSVLVDGITLGEGCVVAAGAIVTKNFPALSVIGGNPARLLKTRGEVKS